MTSSRNISSSTTSMPRSTILTALATTSVPLTTSTTWATAASVPLASCSRTSSASGSPVWNVSSERECLSLRRTPKRRLRKLSSTSVPSLLPSRSSSAPRRCPSSWTRRTPWQSSRISVVSPPSAPAVFPETVPDSKSETFTTPITAACVPSRPLKVRTSV